MCLWRRHLNGKYSYNFGKALYGATMRIKYLIHCLRYGGTQYLGDILCYCPLFSVSLFYWNSISISNIIATLCNSFLLYLHIPSLVKSYGLHFVFIFSYICTYLSLYWLLSTTHITAKFSNGFFCFQSFLLQIILYTFIYIIFLRNSNNAFIFPSDCFSGS